MLDIFILCTRSSHRGKGVGGQLISRALETAAAEGIREAFSMGLSNFSQKIFKKMDFEEKVEICYEDYCQDGEKVFDTSLMGEHARGILFTKMI